MPLDSRGAWNCVHVKVSAVLFNVINTALDAPVNEGRS
jgi:hypothetical protein